MINPNLDLDALSQAYRSDDRIRINNIFSDEIAQRLHACVEELPFDYILHADGQNRVLSEAQMAAFSAEEKRAMQAKLWQGAAQGIGFLYCGYMMNRRERPANRDLAFLHDVYEGLQQEDALAWFRRLTGIGELGGVEGQYTRYTPGQFLTRHSDNIAQEKRLVAFVFGLTKQWHPDWGGLLQFYQQDGTPRDAWLPEFNTLSIFDVRHVHSVSYVTPFAAGKRHSLTGWFIRS